ncbi:divalent cation resistant determinant protein C [Cupriavidus basilensis OR16]|uniref:Divalent cation resistant determinant protein C n=1 Tax=Cupriavidus basilensis OR16 TaxID=1127483 RepID=H1S6X3_9BURK|nr:divalent cation resistant determinant protein C [Cupriavidus basilensis OR16]
MRDFIARHAMRASSDWPPPRWNLDTLTLAAFYFNADLDIARARLATTEASIQTAAQRPNPSLQLPSQHTLNPRGGDSPWTLGIALDIPIQTAGKRGYRIDQATHFASAARLDVANIAWSVRSQLRTQLLNLWFANSRTKLLKQQLALDQRLNAMLEKRVRLGDASAWELNQQRLALIQAQADLLNAQRQASAATVQVANVLGLRPGVLDGLDIDLADFEKPYASVPVPEIRLQALLNRADVRSGLAQYEASQAALQLEVAKQYPDIHLGPGYTFDQGLRKLGFDFTNLMLPIFNRNEGPIAEARARRLEAEAQVKRLESQAMGEIDGAVAAYQATHGIVTRNEEQVRLQGIQLLGAQRSFEAGQTDRMALARRRTPNAAGHRSAGRCHRASTLRARCERQSERLGPMTMIRNTILKGILLLSPALLAALVLGGFLLSKGEQDKEAQREAPVPSAVRITMTNGFTTLMVDAAMQARSGFQVDALAPPASATSGPAAYGIVLDLQPLVEMASRHAAGLADLNAAQAALDASRADYDRLQTLNADAGNVSLKTVEAAHAALAAARARCNAARAGIAALASAARQQFGPALSAWASTPESAELAPLVARREVLLRVVLPAGLSAAAPTRLKVTTDGFPAFDARLISPSPQVDPGILGQAYFYRAMAPLATGTRVTAHVAIAPGPDSGLLVPAGAIVWYGGQPWAYVQSDNTHFQRRPVDPRAPQDGDFVVTEGFKPAERVVVRGAQLLLSEESRAQLASQQGNDAR